MAFTKQKYVADFGTVYVMYTKNSVILNQDRVRQTSEIDLILSIPKNATVCHPMNGNVDSTAFLAASKRIKSSFEHSVSQKYRHIDGFQSVVMCLQIFSDKSQTSLSAEAIQFYPLHVTLQNVKENARQKHALNDATVVAFLPVTHRSLPSISRSSNLLKQQIGKKNHLRIVLVRDHHHIIEICLAPFAINAMKDMPCQTKNSKQVLVHTKLTSYVADIFGTEDLLGLERGSETLAPC